MTLDCVCGTDLEQQEGKKPNLQAGADAMKKALKEVEATRAEAAYLYLVEQDRLTERYLTLCVGVRDVAAPSESVVGSGFCRYCCWR